MCRGVENLPIVAAGLTLPPSTRLHLQHTKKTVQAGTLIKFASVAGKAGLMRQFNLVVNSSNYRYQEGCMSAMIDQTPLFLSSGLEDYFLGASSTHRWMAHTDVVPAVSGAYFHSMPTEHLPYSGFENIQPATSEPEAIATNSLAACAPKPVLRFLQVSNFRAVRCQTASTSRTRCCSRAPSSSSGSPPPTTATRTRASATVSQSNLATRAKLVS